MSKLFVNVNANNCIKSVCITVAVDLCGMGLCIRLRVLDILNKRKVISQIEPILKVK